MEGAEKDVKEFLEFVAEENLQHEQLWFEFCAWFEAEYFSRTIEAIGKRLAGKLRRALYDRGINIRADRNTSSVDALCVCFDLTRHRFSPGLALRHSSHVMVQAEHQMIQMERMGMMTTTAETLEEGHQLVATTIPTDGADPLAVLCKTKYIHRGNS
jgi:hypothetical protein